MNTEEVKVYLTPSEVSRLLGIGFTTLWRWDKAGTGPPAEYTAAGRRRYELGALREWQRQRETERCAG